VPEGGDGMEQIVIRKLDKVETTQACDAGA
jgi:hypothetical protein